MKHAILIANKILESSEAITTLQSLMLEDECNIEKDTTQPSLMPGEESSIEKTWVILKKIIKLILTLS